GLTQDFVLDLSPVGGPICKISKDGSPQNRWLQMRQALEFLKTLPQQQRMTLVDSLVSPYSSFSSGIKMLDEKELKYLAAHPGVTIGGHTHGHELLDQL